MQEELPSADPDVSVFQTEIDVQYPAETAVRTPRDEEVQRDQVHRQGGAVVVEHYSLRTAGIGLLLKAAEIAFRNHTVAMVELSVISDASVRNGSAVADVGEVLLAVYDDYHGAVRGGRSEVPQQMDDDDVRLISQRAQERAEQAVQLKAVAAAVVPHDLVEQVLYGKGRGDAFAPAVHGVKGDVGKLGVDDPVQPFSRRFRGFARKTDTLKICAGVGKGCVKFFVHGYSLSVIRPMRPERRSVLRAAYHFSLSVSGIRCHTLNSTFR